MPNFASSGATFRLMASDRIAAILPLSQACRRVAVRKPDVTRRAGEVVHIGSRLHFVVPALPVEPSGGVRDELAVILQPALAGAVLGQRLEDLSQQLGTRIDLREGLAGVVLGGLARVQLPEGFEGGL